MAVDPTNPLMNNAVLQNLIKPTDPSGGVPAMAGATVMDQPIEVRLKYGSSFHAEILSRLNARQMLSERNMTMRYDDWQRVDEHCRLYIDLSRSARRSDKSSNTNKKEMPWERAIVVPMSYAILQVEMTQVMGIFMRRDPILEVMGAGPEDIRPAKVMQSVLGYDQNQTRFPLQLFSASQNAFKYGLGSMYDCWNDQYGWKFNKRQPNPMLDYLGVPEVTRTWDLIKQYNQVESVDPYNYWPDPRCSMTDVQNMEFVGHRVWRGFLYVLERSQENGGPYFNIDAVRRTIGGSRRDVRVRNRFQTTQHLVMSGSQDDQDKGFHALDHMQVKLVPKTWKLGDGDKPEIWWFTVVDKTIIIRAHQSQYWHGEFSYSGMESNFDPHVTFNPGDIENLDGLARFMNWFYNSHVQNVWRHLNNSMIYAPTLVEEIDILNPTAAGHFRLSALGEKLVQEGRITIDQIVHQLNLHDVTGGMLGDVNQLFDWGMRMTGAADQFQGVNPEQDRTLGENQQVVAGGSSRMAMRAGIIETTGILPTGRRMISNRQQFTTEEQFFAITGDLARELQTDRLSVTPDQIQGNLDMVPRSNPEPPDAGEMRQSWEALAAVLGQNPALLTMPDSMGRVPDPQELFKEYARSGLKIRNIESYYRQLPPPPVPAPVQVLPDETVQRMRERGNVVPLRQPGAAA